MSVLVMWLWIVDVSVKPVCSCGLVRMKLLPGVALHLLRLFGHWNGEGWRRGVSRGWRGGAARTRREGAPGSGGTVLGPGVKALLETLYTPQISKLLRNARPVT